ncbi:MAG: hypothetical protein LBQ49_01550 [Rickettsiales bacterium]|jgi:hypothetical protein|nr:hypothetical protein [Rickettsiales bacterium]
MKTYAEKDLPKEDQKILYEIKNLIDSVDEFDLDHEMTCHEITYAVSNIFSLKKESGRYHAGFYHSWLVTENGNIIDVYPWGTVGGPLLIAHQMQGRDFYRAGEINGDISSDKFKKAVKIIEDALRQNIEKKKIKKEIHNGESERKEH